MGEGRREREVLRYTVRDAAAILGVTTGAVRNRLSRGTLQSVKEHGTVYVLLPADTSRDTARDTGDIPGESSALISEMRDRITFLEQEMEAWREESRRKDTIIMNMTEAMKALSPPAEEEAPEPRESPETATEQPGR